jgi:hypothetical protein
VELFCFISESYRSVFDLETALRSNNVTYLGSGSYPLSKRCNITDSWEYCKVGSTPVCVKTCNSQDTMSATWRKERNVVETNEIMKTAAHRSESWCWRPLLSLLFCVDVCLEAVGVRPPLQCSESGLWSTVHPPLTQYRSSWKAHVFSFDSWDQIIWTQESFLNILSCALFSRKNDVDFTGRVVTVMSWARSLSMGRLQINPSFQTSRNCQFHSVKLLYRAIFLWLHLYHVWLTSAGGKLPN